MSSVPTPTTPRRVLTATTATRGTPTRTRVGSSLNSPNRPASPQVKAAIAAARAKKQQQQQRQPTDSAQVDPFSTPVKPGSVSQSHDLDDLGPGSASKVIALNAGQTDAPGEVDQVVLEWGGKTTDKLLNEAKKTGRLNLASRSLRTVPMRAYSTLSPTTSPFHPRRLRVHRLSSSPRQAEAASMLEDDSVPWYEQVDLTSLVIANNELEQLEEEIGAFEDLQILDVHNNLLTSLPGSVAFLKSLTSLNLSANKLDAFPTHVLKLKSLKDLDISSNALHKLWPHDWREIVENLQAPTAASPSASPESAPQNSLSFWNDKPDDHEEEEQDETSSPFPLMRLLNVSDNPFDPSAFFTAGLSLPRNLITLDLSRTRLRQFPHQLLSALPRLAHLRLVGNSLTDSAFQIDATKEPCPSLETLDVSHNELDTLQHLEDLFSQRATPGDAGRKVEWVGLERPVENVIKATERARLEQRGGVNVGEGEGSVSVAARKVVTITIWENRLSHEQARRRKIWQEVVQGPKKTTPIVRMDNPENGVGTENISLTDKLAEVKLDSATVLADDAALPARQLRDDHPPPYSAAEEGLNESKCADKTPQTVQPTRSPAKEDDATVVLIQSGVVSGHGRPTIDLQCRSLDVLPTIAAGQQLPEHLRDMSRVTLAHNAMTAMPVATLLNWDWASTLVVLNLSRNRIVSLDLPTLATTSSISTACFPHLKTLDLSWNQLTSDTTVSDGSTAPLLSTLSTLAPNLATLDLCQNRLTTMAGIDVLLLNGIKEVLLQGNKVDDVAALTDLAQRMADSQPGADELQAQWKCEVLDMRDNEIARLPPVLGYLPHSLIFHVIGNRIRIPRRDVYENAGQRLLLPWLRGRL